VAEVQDKLLKGAKSTTVESPLGEGQKITLSPQDMLQVAIATNGNPFGVGESKELSRMKENAEAYLKNKFGLPGGVLAPG
jgi:hypothetical protein